MKNGSTFLFVTVNEGKISALLLMEKIQKMTKSKIFTEYSYCVKEKPFATTEEINKI